MYYRLGRSYPRIQTRQPYPKKRRRSYLNIKNLNQVINETISLIEEWIVVNSGQIVLENLDFIETLTVHVAYSRTISESITFNETYDHNDLISVALSDNLSLVEILSKTHAFAETISENLSFTEILKRIKEVHLNETLILTENLAHQRIHFPIPIFENLSFIESLKCGKSLHRTFSENLGFYEYGTSNTGPHGTTYPVNTDFGIISVPIWAITKKQKYIILQSGNTSLKLPRPTFGDELSSSNLVKVNRSMNGTRYTYVRTSNRLHLKWHFYISRAKSLELKSFINAYSADYMYLIDWEGTTWIVKFFNNPFEFVTTRRSSSEIARLDIDLEFEGFRLFG